MAAGPGGPPLFLAPFEPAGGLAYHRLSLCVFDRCAQTGHLIGVLKLSMCMAVEVEGLLSL